MANYRLMIPKIKKWEGGWSDNPNDSGGATMKGITLSTFRSYYGKNKTKEDLRKITDLQWEHIFKTGYWNRMKADSIVNQSLAELCVQTIWGSGGGYIKSIQKQIGVVADGVVGPITLGVLNGNPKQCFERIWEGRRQYFNSICIRNPKNSVFLKGWLNRLNDYRYKE